MDTSFYLGIGRLSGGITIFPTLDAKGGWMQRLGRGGQPLVDRLGQPLLVARCIYTLLINDAPKKADGTSGDVNRKTVTDFSYARIKNVYLRFCPIGIQLLVMGRDNTYRKDLGANLPPDKRYLHLNSVIAQTVKLGARSAKHEADTHVEYRIKNPVNGQITVLQAELAPRRQVVRTASPAGTTDFVDGFASMVGGKVVSATTYPAAAPQAAAGVSSLVSTFLGQ